MRKLVPVISGRLACYTGLKRLRHYRGHNIHSPFVYSVVRNVLMNRSIEGDDSLYNVLRSHNIPERTSRQLQNLHNYCNYAQTSVVAEVPVHVLEGSLVIVYAGSNMPDTDRITWGEGSALVVVGTSNCRSTVRTACRIVDRRVCLSIDNRGYYMFFYSRDLPVQHFKL